MVAIEARYIGPTNTKGSRIRVRRMDYDSSVVGNASGASRWYQYDDSLSRDDVYAEPIKQFCREWGWFGKFVMGGTTAGHVAVFVPDDTPVIEFGNPKVYEVKSCE